jgi:hypothetical protein
MHALVSYAGGAQIGVNKFGFEVPRGRGEGVNRESQGQEAKSGRERKPGRHDPDFWGGRFPDCEIATANLSPWSVGEECTFLSALARLDDSYSPRAVILATLQQVKDTLYFVVISVTVPAVVPLHN